MDKYRLAVLTSHPIQYQGPLFREIAADPKIDLMVYFFWNRGGESGDFDPEFGKKVAWDIPLLQGYRYKFLKNISARPSSEFWGQVNFGIMKELWRNKYDAVLSMGWNSFSAWLAFFSAFGMRTPVFIKSENPFNQEILKGNLKRQIKKIILGWFFRQASGFLYIGEENKKFYEYYGVPEEKLFFCPYAVDNQRFVKGAQTLKPEIKDLRKKLNIGEKDDVILFVGKLIRKKNPIDLLKAFELLTGKYQLQAHLVFVGEGNLIARLENYARIKKIGNVHFMGFKNQTEISEYYAISDVIVLPSGLGETWGLVINEAMCFGVIPVVSDVVGCGPDLVRQNENGYIFKLGQIGALAAALHSLMTDKKKKMQFSQKSKNIILNYSYERDIEALKGALAKVILN